MAFGGAHVFDACLMSVESRIDALGVLQIIGYHALGRRTNPLKHPDFCRKARLALCQTPKKFKRMFPRARHTRSLGGLLDGDQSTTCTCSSGGSVTSKLEVFIHVQQ